MPRRLAAAFRRRLAAAWMQTSHRSDVQERNDDEAAYGPGVTYGKGLPRADDWGTDAAAAAALAAALDGDGSFEDVPLGGGRRLVNPAAARSFVETGRDPHDVRMPAPPSVASEEMAAEAVELYWQALCRDVPFVAYGTDPTAADAAAELSALDAFEGPRDAAGAVTPDLLFRGGTAGDAVGPYLSQFLLATVPRGEGLREERRYRPLAPGVDYATDEEAWLATVSGEPTAAPAFASAPRYIATGRDLASYVHRDAPFQAYLDAALILLGLGAPLSPDPPPVGDAVRAGFVDFGPHDVLDAVTGVLVAVQRANWCQKWLGHRRLRPEEYAGLIHATATGRGTHPVPESVRASTAARRIRERDGGYLLPQAYPEGAPLHPSYPAGHAGIAGACVTVLKAFFDESWAFPDPVEPDATGERLDPVDATLTVGGELEKLASNASLGRSWAGIHYRSDAAGLRLGESVALAYLCDRARAYDDGYGFAGFELTTSDGTGVRTAPDGVESV
jgi:membrane-associated phospholipid phosphatase